MKDAELLTEYKDASGYIITHYTSYGGKASFETTKDWKKIVDIYEDMWDYVEVEDKEGNMIYKTIGVDQHKERMGYR